MRAFRQRPRHSYSARVSPPPLLRAAAAPLLPPRALGLYARRCPALGQQHVCVRVVRQENGTAFYQQRPESKKTTPPDHGRKRRLSEYSVIWVKMLFIRVCM